MTLAARIRRLSVAFHERTILHDITLDIPAGPVSCWAPAPLCSHR